MEPIQEKEFKQDIKDGKMDAALALWNDSTNSDDRKRLATVWQGAHVNYDHTWAWQSANKVFGTTSVEVDKDGNPTTILFHGTDSHDHKVDEPVYTPGIIHNVQRITHS